MKLKTKLGMLTYFYFNRKKIALISVILMILLLLFFCCGCSTIRVKGGKQKNDKYRFYTVKPFLLFGHKADKKSFNTFYHKDYYNKKNDKLTKTKNK